MTKEKQTMQELRSENKRMRSALFKIMDIYARAPGMTANPTPTTKLVWSMYQAALKAAAVSQPPPR